MELTKAEAMLNTYLRPQTFPVAVRMLRTAEEIPPKAKLPQRDFGCEIAVCQAVALARRYGWVVCMGGEDTNCPGGALALGFYEADAAALDGTFAMPFWGDRDVRGKIVSSIPRLEAGKHSYMVVSPLPRASFEPQLVLIYGDAAQMSRLMQANTLMTGEQLTSSGFGAFACAAEISLPMQTGRCQVTVPGGGERAVAHTQDHELCFSVPYGRLEGLLGALEETHRAGSRYPVPSHLTYQAEFPNGYAELMQHLRT